MKRFISLASIFLILFSCSQSEQKSIISGKINLIDYTGDYDIVIGLYNFKPYGELGTPINLLHQKSTTFEFNVEQGNYVLAIYSFNHEVNRTNIVIPDNKTQITLNIKIPKLSIDNEISKVSIIGDFCRWDDDDEFLLKQKADKWVLSDTSLLNKGEQYKFIVNDKFQIWNLSEKEIKTMENWSTFNSIYSGGEIIFNPALYQQPKSKTTAEINGSILTKQFNTIFDELRQVNEENRQFRKIIRTGSEADSRKAYKTIKTNLDKLQAKYDRYFSPIFIENRFDKYLFLHPYLKKYSSLATTGKLDSTKKAELIYTQDFKEFAEEYMAQIKLIDPKSFLFDGEFTNIMLYFQFYLNDSPDILKKYNISDSYCEEILVEITNQSKNKDSVAKILYELGRTFGRQREIAKARKYLHKLKTEYPNNYYVTRGIADKILTSLQLVPGNAAPAFSAITTSNKNISLSDYKGKFVLLDFWHTGCGFCIHEFPNLRKLAKSINADKIQIIGLARDDMKALRQFLKKEKLPYPNVHATSELLAQYGIIGYPTVYLINPEGKIVTREGLRGEQLSKTVNQSIKEYYSM